MKTFLITIGLLIPLSVMAQWLAVVGSKTGGPYPVKLIAHVKLSGNGSQTSAGINTTGATLLVAAQSTAYNHNPCASGSVSDSKSNTWTAIQEYNAGGSAGGSVCIWYAANPTVGTGHTFSSDGYYSTTFFAAFSGVAASTPLDVQTGATSTSAHAVNTGSVTPGANYEVCVATGGEFYVTESVFAFPAPSQAFSLIDSQATASGAHYGGALGYFVEGPANPVSTTYTYTGGSTDVATAIACFKHK
jgi:hypothetical protein